MFTRPPGGGSSVRERLLLLRVAAVLVAFPLGITFHFGGPVAGAVSGAVAIAIACLAGAARRGTRIEWDGREVVQRTPIWCRTIGVAHQGLIVRAQLTGPSSVAPQFGPMLYWLAADGSMTTMLPESQWELGELQRLVSDAQIPFYDAGRVTAGWLAATYPGTARALAATRLADRRAGRTAPPRATRIGAIAVLVFIVLWIVVLGPNALLST
ncbi:MAG: hypothetical protein J7513_06575 [Solirubrobacteraceae bacterium]|nr:hypothetical protein [Solirubrobacteraceae bacterium]